jgi:hypothetical protein
MLKYLLVNNEERWEGDSSFFLKKLIISALETGK